MKNKNIKKTFSKKNLSLLMIASSIAVVPMIVGAAHITLNSKSISSIDNQSSYESQLNSTFNYIKNNHKVSTRKVENMNSIWTINYNSNEYSFNDPKQIKDFINKNIIIPGKETWVSSIADLSKYVGPMGDISIDNISNDENVSLFEKEKNIDSKTLTQDIYRGNNDKAYLSEHDAKKSFMVESSAYFFNEIYFTNKEDLKRYLLDDYLPNNQTSYNTITLKGPNGITSQPINVTSKTASLEIERFVKNNSNVTLNYTNSETGEFFNINKNNLESNLKNVNLKDLNYLHVQSNQGESRYVIDNYDDANLIGPYFYKGNLDVGSFKNKKMWRKTNDIKKNVYVESKIDTMIGGFFSSVINDEKALILREASDEGKVPSLFRTSLIKVNEKAIYDEKTGQMVDESLPMDDWFLAELKNLSPALFYDVAASHIGLISGNKYNTFYKIPILYNFLLSRIVAWGLDQQVLDLVNYYFTQVTNFIQDTLEIIFDDKSLFEKKVGDKIVYFNAKDFFQIGNPEYDFNTSIEYFLNEMKTYPKLVAAMWAYNTSFTNLFLTGGMIPFESAERDYLFENGLISEVDFNANIATYKKIYNMFSKVEYSEILDILIPNSNNPKIQAISKMDRSLWEKEFDKLQGDLSGVPYNVVIKSIGMKNIQYHTIAKTYLEEEIDLYNKEGRIFNNGYLKQLYNKNPKRDSLANYIIYMNANPTEDSYKVYLAFLLAHKLNRTDFMGDNEYTDKTSFALAVARLIGFAFGTTALVGNTIGKVYNSSSNVNNGNHTLTLMTEDKIDGIGNESEVRRMKSDSEDKEDPIAFKISAYTYDAPTKIEKPSTAGKVKAIAYKINFDDSKVEKNNVKSTRTIEVENHRLPNRPYLDVTDPNIKRFPLSQLSPFDADVAIIRRHMHMKVHESVLVKMGMSQDEIQKFIGEFQLLKTKEPIRGFRSKIYELRPQEGISDMLKSDSIYADAAWKILTDDYDKTTKKRIHDFSGNRRYFVNDLHPDKYRDPNNPHWVTPEKPNKKTKYKLNKKNISDDSTKNQKKWWQWKNNNNDAVDGVNPRKMLSIKNAGLDSTSSIKKAFTEVMSVASTYILSTIGTAIMLLEIVTMMIELFKTTTIKDFYVYTTADGTEFIWDGGMTITKYLGFEVNQIEGIDSMEIIEPIKITLPQVEEYYYFDEIKYYDVEQLKRASLLSMLEQKTIPLNKSNTFSLSYSLINDEQIIDGTKTIDELVTYIYSQIGVTKNEDGSLNASNLNKNSKYISNLSYAFSNGLIVTDQSKYMAIRDNIASNIRKTNIIQLPKKDDFNNALTNDSFILAGNVYKNGKVINVKSDYEYIVDNSANLLKEGVNPIIGEYKSSNYLIENINDAEKNSIENAKNNFNKQIQVTKKTGIVAEMQNKKYSEISSNLTRHDIYSVNLDPSKGMVRFSNIKDAEKYILTQLNFKKHISYEVINVYNYNGQFIYGDEELLEYTKILTRSYLNSLN